MEMKFNLQAMAAPATKQEYIALLDEALRVVDELTALTFEGTRLMEQQASAAECAA
jgi:hypothetical protein